MRQYKCGQQLSLQRTSSSLIENREIANNVVFGQAVAIGEDANLGSGNTLANIRITHSPSDSPSSLK